MSHAFAKPCRGADAVGLTFYGSNGGEDCLVVIEVFAGFCSNGFNRTRRELNEIANIVRVLLAIANGSQLCLSASEHRQADAVAAQACNTDFSRQRDPRVSKRFEALHGNVDAQ
jgi:hypothetical protein